MPDFSLQTSALGCKSIQKSGQLRPLLRKTSLCREIEGGILLGKAGVQGKIKKKSVFREYAEAAIIAILLALFIRTFVVQAFKIPSGSMEPTLLVGDHILVNKFIYGVKLPFVGKTIIPIQHPHRDDVIVFIYPMDPSKDFIKRVIGLPGDRIEMIGHSIYINGKLFQDRHGVYTASPDPTVRFGPVIVPEGHLFVMGDNRDHSYDSRFWGFVPLESVKGKAFIVYWSWPHWKRFFHMIK
ncbi:MAG TPA: signal peptidase I [Desulfobacteraceae bacterium]|nr:signal peptidase I [Desulfobacteraceae bacterium]